MSGRIRNSPIEMLDLENGGGGSRWNFDDISFHSGDRGGVANKTVVWKNGVETLHACMHACMPLHGDRKSLEKKNTFAFAAAR